MLNPVGPGSPGHASSIRAIPPHCNSPSTQTDGQVLKPGGSSIAGQSGCGEFAHAPEEDELEDDELLELPLLEELEEWFDDETSEGGVNISVPESVVSL